MRYLRTDGPPLRHRLDGAAGRDSADGGASRVRCNAETKKSC